MALSEEKKRKALRRLEELPHNLEFPSFLENYEGSKSKVKAVCPIHGEFERRYDLFTEDSGCPRCSIENKTTQYDTESVKERLSLLYPVLDLSKVDFKGVREPIILIHPEHGELERTPESIFKSSSINFKGTRIKAANVKVASKVRSSSSTSLDLIKEVQEYLDSLEIEYEVNYILNDYKYSFYIPSVNLLLDVIISSNRHSSNSDKTSLRTRKTYQGIKENHMYWKNAFDNDYKYFAIYDIYWNIEERKEVYKAKIKHLLDMDERVYARSCVIEELPLKEAKAFVQTNHLEGAGFIYKDSKAFCLKRKKDQEVLLVAIVGKIFKQGSDSVFEPKLQRICTKLGVTVVGGISKLTRYIQENTEYSDFSYQITLSTGGSSIRSSPNVRFIDPRYYWVDPRSLTFYHRNYCQKSVLEKHFGVPVGDMTEREYMEHLGYLRLFDNGLAEIEPHKQGAQKNGSEVQKEEEKEV